MSDLLTREEITGYLSILDTLPAGSPDIEKIDQLFKADKKERCRQNFLPFVRQMWGAFIPGKHHQIMADAFERVARGELKRLIINMPPRHAIMVGMKIPTTCGFKTMGELQAGDYVFGPDGVPTEVLGKSEVFTGRQLYRVTTDDNASIEVDGEHLWTVRLDRKHSIYNSYTTEQIYRRQNGEILRTKRGGGVEFLPGKSKDPRPPRLPDCDPVQYPYIDLPVDPYVLGTWLGDGSSSHGVVTSKDDDAVFIRAEFERRGVKTTDQSTRYTFGTLGLKVALRNLGVLGNKHIPRQYLTASATQRRDLLKGLMDTDGNVSKAGQCFFAQSNRDFIEQVAELLRSLGIKANILESEAKIGAVSYGSTWKISFYASDVFNLPRKESRTLKTKRAFGRYIKIEALDKKGDTQCIKVAREDGLFLAGEGYICTHNTKSEFASFLFPSWFLGLYPEKKIIQTAHTAELAVGFGRKVRNLVGSADYQEVFSTKLQSDSKAAGRWNTNKGGDYFAIGVGGAVTGKGADVLIIDDPHSEQEAMQGTPQVYDRVFEWYSSGPRQRLQPGGAIVIVMCMVGSTRVLLSDGTEKPLRDICIGDLVATYEDGVLATAKINNWQSSGIDSIYTVKTQSGRILQANARHPFLVDFSGERKWIQLKDLKPNMLLVATKAATDPLDLKQYPDSALLAKQEEVTIRRTRKPRTVQSGIMGNGKEKTAGTAIPTLLKPKDYVVTAIQSSTLQKSQRQRKAESGALSIGTELPVRSMTAWLRSAATGVMSAGSYLLQKIQGRTGTGSYVSTMTMPPELSEDCSAMTATLPLDMAKHQKNYNEPLNTYSVILDKITSITPSGEEEVFDVEVDRTENFIANGVVSHNTRWSKRDLTGQILNNAIKRDLEDWEVIELPALLPSGKPLWAEFWKQTELEAIKAELPVAKWEAQYQQNPTSEGGAIIKREMWKIWDREKPPEVDYIIQSWDTAFEKTNRADYSACTTWGVFYREIDGIEQANIIVLDAFKERMEFPELKRTAYDLWKEWNPDTLLVEKKAAGAPLIYELRKAGLPVSEYTPGKGSDKIARVNAVSDLFASGMVWRPDTRWADELVEEVASFPNGDHDDLVDSTTQALLRFRRGGFIHLSSDEEDKMFIPKKAAYY